MSLTRAPLRAEVHLSLHEFAVATGISPTRLARLVRLGLLEPEPGAPGRFSAATAARLRRMLRLRADLGVNLAGAAIIVDLMEALDRLDAELTRWRGQRWT
jgi:DNA-binding transcriptional MerR regulator